jgi:tRNA nucleotidyltransferase (CCA-adding enzyme)
VDNRHSVPAYLTPLLSLFASHGEAAYPVGGCVRDTLMGIPPHDWDVAVTTPPDTTLAICKAAGYRVIPTGIQHGTVSVLAPHSGDPSDREGGYELIECTTCRTEGGYTDGRHPDAVTFTGLIEDDLSRRDFTVNAMAFTQQGDTLSVLDLFGGQDDLQAGVIRAVGDPDTRFTEDALRLMRGVRFAVKLGFQIEPNTYAAMGRRAEGLSRISRERVSEEFQKILTSPEPERGITLLTHTGLLPYVLPCGISPMGTGNLSSLSPDFAVRMACLLWGQDDSKTVENLAGLRLPNAVRKDILAITRSTAMEVKATPKKARQWRHYMGDLTLPALAVRRARETQDTAELDELIRMVEKSIQNNEPVRIADLDIDGTDLISLGFKPGRLLQDILCDLLEVVWNDPTKNSREELIKEALRRKD